MLARRSPVIIVIAIFAVLSLVAIGGATAYDPSSDAVTETVTATAPTTTTTTTTTTEAGPSQADLEALWIAKTNQDTWINTTRWANTTRWVDATNERLAQERRQRELAAQEQLAAVERPAAERAQKSIDNPGTGRCGGDLPPCYVMMRESGGNIRARNPSSSASGKWQFISSTWAGFGGYAEAYLAPESVQDAKARQLWAGGAGCGHWNAC